MITFFNGSAGLGAGLLRDETYKNYINEKIRFNDIKVVAPFSTAAIQHYIPVD